jgi:hypothetical protein
VPHFAALTALLAAAAKKKGAEVPDGAYATFGDGLALQKIIDAIRQGGTVAEPPGAPSPAVAGAGTGK